MDMIVLPESEDIEVRMLLKLFDDMTNSYKIFWFKGLYEEIIKGKTEIFFIDIVAGMVSNAWYPKLTYHLNFGTQDKLGICINNINELEIKNSSISKHDLYRIVVNAYENKVIFDEIKFLFKYVPFRAIAPFFEKELKGKKDGDKNKIIEDLSKNNKYVIYEINSKEKKIKVNEKWREYIIKNQGLIHSWIQYKLIEYLQRKNPNSPAIINKLDPPLERDLKEATKIWRPIIQEKGVCDIYTNALFNEENFNVYGNLSIDHFIPWSFIGHDMIWNLVPTFKNVNSSKSDSLPSLDNYFNSFMDKQILLLEYIRKNKVNTKVIEDYFAIDNKLDIKSILDISNELNQNKIKDDLESTINPLYQIAYNQGFNIWSYNEMSKNVMCKEIDNIKYIIN